MPKLAAVILGLLLLLAGTIGCFMLAGNPPANLFFLPPALAMSLIPIGCCIIAFGLRGPLVVLRAFTVPGRLEPTETSEAARVISACIGYVYGAGAFVLLASLLTITASVAVSSLAEGLGPNVAPTIASVIYPVVLAELVLRPLKHRLG